MTPRFSRTAGFAICAFLSVLPVAAQASDPNLCPILKTVAEASTNRFKAIRGKKTDRHEWNATSILPLADSCTTSDDNFGDQAEYSCMFSPSDESGGRAHIIDMVRYYADNIADCRPDLTRSVNAHDPDDVDFSDDKGRFIKVSVFDDFFSVDVFEPGTYHGY